MLNAADSGSRSAVPISKTYPEDRETRELSHMFIRQNNTLVIVLNTYILKFESGLIRAEDLEQRIASTNK